MLDRRSRRRGASSPSGARGGDWSLVSSPSLGVDHVPSRVGRRWVRGPFRSVAGVVVLILLLALVAASHFSGGVPWARSIPAATALDPRLERAVDRAIAAAGDEGVELRVTSGLRSVDEQRTLWNAALDEYGGPFEASRWVLPPEHSEHVQGRAVDVGPAGGAQWLAENGTRWGLCQVFANEPWHFERLTKKNGTCPELLPDASHLLDLG